MKTCKLCGSTYGDKVDFCFRDGQPLVRGDDGDAPKAPAGRGRPSLADMLDVPEPGFGRADATDLPGTGGRSGGPGLHGSSPATDLPSDGAAELPPDPSNIDPNGESSGSASSGSDTEEALAPSEDPSATGAVSVFADTRFADTRFANTVSADTELPPTEDEEGLAPPAPLAPLAPTAPIPLARDGADPMGQTLLPPAGEDEPEDAELPGPRSLHADEPDAGRDEQAMADIARTLGHDAAGSSGLVDFEDESEPEEGPAASHSPALDDLVGSDDDAPRKATFIGADGASEGLIYADTSPPPSNNKVLLGLFGGALILTVVGVGYILTNSGPKGTDPLAGKPEEHSAPVVAAPAPPPTPVPEPPMPEPPMPEPPTPEPQVAPADVAPAGASPADVAPVAPVVAPPSQPAAVAAPAAPHPAAPVAAATQRAATPAAPVAPRALPASDASADASGGSDPWSTAASHSTGRLTINTIPAGASVYVDERQVGRSPLSSELGFGMHTIRVELGGYSSEQRTIDVEVPEMAVPFEMKALVVTGTVNIFGPTGATVLVDGAQVGKIPTSVRLTEGAHAFDVRTADGSSFTRSQDVRFQGGSTVSVTLSPP